MADEFMFSFRRMFRSRADCKADFIRVVKKGDILVSRRAVLFGMIGHAALMVSDDWVLEMPGAGAGFSASSSQSSSQTLEDNNRRISKNNWFDEHVSDEILVYRCCDNSIAIMAADWAYTHYYNPSGGEEKTIHIRYSLISPDFEDTDPSYCSKLVLQAFHYGTGSADVISTIMIMLRFTSGNTFIPNAIPTYFKYAYRLNLIGMF